ncbi:Vegetative incompatibility protein HET-E-1 [Colletotrichum siamense]|nr:Vegetative incompatibility protein HET-E-1 [Colletotrichum siamense]
MVGIGAGIPRRAFDIRLGDVVVSKPVGESSGVVQYDLGKIEKDGLFRRVGFLAAPPDFLLTALGKLEAEHILQDSQMPNILLQILQRYPALAKPKNNGIPYVHQGAHNDRLFSASATHIDIESPGNHAGIMHTIQKADHVPWNTWHFLYLTLAWLKWLICFLIVSPLKVVSTTAHKSAVSIEPAEMQGILAPEACASCDSSQEIKRQPRSSTEPVIHNGVIASGNSMVKDGVSRDEILRRIDSNCICFEMEAAGLMRTFPCIVVRGVCDYADTHKNDRWQNYAAAAAAAYAKELLLQVDPADLEQARSIKEIMDGLTDKVSVITLNTEETRQNTQDLKKLAQREKVEKLLSAFERSTVHNTTRNQHHKDTGQWLFQNYDYLSWKQALKSLLWLYGKPGSGKTILSSTIIEDLKLSEASVKSPAGLSNPVLYFYFAFNDSRRQSLDDAIRSLIHQLYRQSELASDKFDLELDHNTQHHDTKFFSRAFRTMVEGSAGACIVLDALDECQTRADFSENQGLLSWIKGLIESNVNIRFLITSRQEYDIKSTLGGKADYRVGLDGPSVTRDIEMYVSGSMSKHDGLKRWSSSEHEDLREQIKRDLTKNADGM